MVVKSVINKSGLKVQIIQAIDRKVPLNVFAESKGLEMSEMLDEIESIVNSGTKLNIDYYINSVMDQDHQDEIFDYFREASTEAIEDALEAGILHYACAGTHVCDRRKKHTSEILRGTLQCRPLI